MSCTTERIRFHDFELRPDSGELFRHERPVKLQQQPTRVLELLARRAGQVVSRDELGKAIWGDKYFVDSDQGLNYCVRQIRIALGDQADTPRFVETVPRRGYRFVAPVRTLEVPVSGWLAGMAAGLVVLLSM